MFCTNCGKENPFNAKFCGHCGFPLNKIIDVEPESVEYNGHTHEDEDNDTIYVEERSESAEYAYVNAEKTAQKDKEDPDEYLNCDDDGNVSFWTMVANFFSKDIKSFFSFNGKYSRLEYLYSWIIAIAVFSPPLLFLIPLGNIAHCVTMPLLVACVWLFCAAIVKRLKDSKISGWKAYVLLVVIVWLKIPLLLVFIPGEKFKEKK